ncbi:hypothetical protein [Actinomadura xylanilytica]|uniref:hypothetical protein n=1 Tax=Actinomadura xylanilytica TaxID=887459 RepID=UPI00255B2435|nr:hypothetical protein [Actinomadura xylanilytica]MDL4775751.1 hypothetical protein [Actinomadura xylanilytica]
MSAVLAYGNVVAMLTGRQGYQVSVLDAATGKPLQRHQLTVAGNSTALGSEPVRLLRDTFQGRPVAVVRFKEQVPASGTQGEHDQLTDLVLDSEGKQVWRTPTTGGRSTDTRRKEGGSFNSGYAISHATTQGTLDKSPEGITSFQSITGGGPVRVNSSYGNDDVHDVVTDKAVMTDDKGLLDEGLRGVDLSQGGKTIWRKPKAEYVGAFGPNLMIENGDRIQQIDPATGQRRSDVAASEISGGSSGLSLDQVESWTYDPDTHAISAGGQRTLIIDGDTGKLRSRQDGPNPRELTATAAGGGVTFMAIEPKPAMPTIDGPAEKRPTSFLALDNRTGKILADNLPLTAISITDNKYALVENDGNFYSFHLKTEE